uniref:Reverse transcriptase domain-containing protein n=1 Tax=Tanacetum cinerariifolium TaxID=118510 RepID=A0A6L2MS79_TANCI|nr:reverse transcriptase domain-containing protein [Tanacetum cinerariifolium]
MRTRSSSNLVDESSPNPTTSNPKRRNRRRSKQRFSLEESPLDTMADQRTIEKLLRAPTEGYAEAIVVPPILAEHFELKHSLINMMTSDQFFRLEKDNPHDNIHSETYSITSAMTTVMTAILKQFQATLPPAFVKAIEEIYVTCGGAHPYYQCLAVDGNTFPEFRDNFQGYISAAAVNYNRGNFGYRPLSVANQIRPSGFSQPNVQNNQNQFSQHQGYNRGNNFNQDTSYQALTQQNQVVSLSELEKIKKINEVNIKAMEAQTNNVKNELRNEMQTSIQASMSKQTNKLKNMMASFFQMNTASTSCSGPLHSNTIANPKGELKAITNRSGIVLDGPAVPMPPPFINPEEDERAEETLTDPELTEYTIKVPPPFVKKAKPHSLRNYVKLPEKLGDHRKFLIPYGFSELKCKALADLGASINLMPLSIGKKLGLPELISTRMTLELANRAICTPAGIARDVFVPVGKFTFPADFVIVDYESDPRVPLILGRPFLRTARALIDVHGEEIILRVSDERLTLNMRHDTSSYSNQPHKQSINMINIYNDSYEDYLEDLFATNHLSGNLTFSFHTDLTSPEVINPLSGNTTFSSPDHLLEEFADELALITFPPGNDDLPFDIESDHREIEYLLNHDPTKEMDYILEDSIDEGNLVDPNNDLVDTIPEMFVDKHTLDFSSPPLYDDVNDGLVELESDNDDVYDDPFDSKEDKIKEFKLLIDELDPPRSSDFCPSPEYDSVLYEEFSKVDTLPSTNNEDKVFNLGILIHESLFKVTLRVTPDKNVKKISISNSSLILEDFNPPLYELPFHKEVPGSETLLSFSSKNKEKVFNPGILTSKGVHTSLLLKLSHRGPKAFKVIKIFESLVEIFPCSYEEDIRILDVPRLHFYPP